MLHTGQRYAQDLSEDGVIYHYPQTNRAPSRDQAEIDAIRAAKDLQLPIFVITRTDGAADNRDVFLSLVEDWDDNLKAFLITFDAASMVSNEEQTEKTAPFQVYGDVETRMVEVATRPNQQRFRFAVFKRYGPSCAVCGLDIPEVLEAAHLASKANLGVDDPLNGIVLCATHHRALDAGLYGIHPHTLELQFRPLGPNASILRITRTDVRHLVKQPAAEALESRWLRWHRTEDPQS